MAVLTNLTNNPIDILNRAGVKVTIAAGNGQTVTINNQDLLYQNFAASVFAGYISISGWVDPTIGSGGGGASGVLPASLGSTTSSASLPIVIASDQAAIPIKDNFAITETAVTVTATSALLIGANTSRRYLAWMVVGTATVTIVPGAGPAVAGVGFPYAGGGANQQGAAQEWPHGAPTNAFQCIAPATGSIVYVWEGV